MIYNMQTQDLARVKHGLMLLVLLYLCTVAHSLETVTNQANVNVGHSNDVASHIEEGYQHTISSTATQLIRNLPSLYTRTVSATQSSCSNVHEAQNQCTWIRDNCDDQDSGLLSYLEFYYCKLPQAKPFAMFVIVLWLTLLFVTIGITASDYFCVNLNTISGFLGLSESVAGVTLLAFGNGSPDVFATWAAMSTGSASLAIGELIGAAGFITGIVAGSMAIIRPFKVAKSSFMRDLGFFIVAIAFTFGFLLDGHLELWESIVMVTFYCFYGIVVILWQWRAKRHKAKKIRDQLARQHFMTPEYSDIQPHDEEDEDGSVGASRQQTPEDEFRLLVDSEEGNIDGDDEDEFKQDHHVAEIITNMRISRPRGISRENTRNSIRPSLVGALEFRAVLSSLERSRSQLSIPLNNRRYSDDILTGIGRQQRLHRTGSDLAPIKVPPPGFVTQDEIGNMPTSARPRAVSTNDIENMRTPSSVPPTARLATRNEVDSKDQPSLPRLQIPMDTNNELSPGNEAQRSSGFLSPSSANRSPDSAGPASPIVYDSPAAMFQSVASLEVPGSTTISASNTSQNHGDGPFAPYHDEPRRGRRSRASTLQLPPAVLQHDVVSLPQPLVKWWPYRFMPPPEELFSTLFPTLWSWSQKNYLQKFLAVITAPSIFVLNITLPVVEAIETTNKSQADDLTKSKSHNSGSQHAVTSSSSQTPLIRTVDEHGQTRPAIQSVPTSHSDGSAVQIPQGWQRWLLCTQLTLAPLLVVTIIWVNLDDDHDTQSLLFGLAIGCLFSILALTALLSTTNAKEPPHYRPIFCILGFIVSVSWISTIANEVVGVLKALGIILNISEAILGLTVFAVGSSLGDLVADITIARLGYPMMALSACFGGPMLNILLGIGIGGVYLLLQRGDKYHHKHPDRPVRYKAYHIEIDRTLVVSSIAILITLIGLAIAVPLSGWRMTRRIGWALITLWVVTTTINLAIEIGAWKKG